MNAEFDPKTQLAEITSSITVSEPKPDMVEEPGEPGDVERGDYVYAEWTTPNGIQKWVRGKVVDEKNNSVWVQYYWEHNDGGLCHYGIKTIRRNKQEVRRVPRLPGELTPHEYVDRRSRSAEFPGSLSIPEALHENLKREYEYRKQQARAASEEGSSGG